MDADKTTTIEELKLYAQRFVEARSEWRKRHSAKNMAAAMVRESSELLDPFTFLSDEECERLLKSQNGREQISAELADVLFHVLEFSGKYGIDLTTTFYSKMEKIAEKYPVEILGNKKYK